jgi:hypothetical protein
MSARLLGAMGRLPIWARRGLMIVFPLLLLVVLVAGFALAPTEAGDHSKQAGATVRLLPPSPTTAAQAHARPARPATKTGQSPAAAPAGQRSRSRKRPGAAHRRRVRGPVSGQPPPTGPRSAEGMMLAVARRFAVAYMRYQVGRLPRWARTAIERTCTPAFARYLLAQPAQLTPLQAAHPKAIETYRVASVEPAGAPDTVAVSYVSEQDSADTGEFLLRLVGEHGHWLVARLEA